MGVDLTLKIPDTTYQALLLAASQMEMTPEELALRWLMAALKSTDDDPVEAHIGCLASSPAESDWLDRHDAYLGQSAF